jgi:hypothetical protein
MSQIETKRFTERCEAKTASGEQCKCYAVFTVRTRKGQLRENPPGEPMGRGVGSQWMHFCEQHAKHYPCESCGLPVTECKYPFQYHDKNGALVP